MDPGWKSNCIDGKIIGQYYFLHIIHDLFFKNKFLMSSCNISIDIDRTRVIKQSVAKSSLD